jgi:hypothetical protein
MFNGSIMARKVVSREKAFFKNFLHRVRDKNGAVIFDTWSVSFFKYGVYRSFSPSLWAQFRCEDGVEQSSKVRPIVVAEHFKSSFCKSLFWGLSRLRIFLH